MKKSELDYIATNTEMTELWKVEEVIKSDHSLIGCLVKTKEFKVDKIEKDRKFVKILNPKLNENEILEIMLDHDIQKESFMEAAERNGATVIHKRRRSLIDQISKDINEFQKGEIKRDQLIKRILNLQKEMETDRTRLGKRYIHIYEDYQIRMKYEKLGKTSEKAMPIMIKTMDKETAKVVFDILRRMLPKNFFGII
jgi:TusA-related sulfurtransferase